MVVVASKYVEIAKSTFQNGGVKVVTGLRFFGGIVGEREYCVQFVREKVDVWVDCVDKLSQAAVKTPQAAFASLTKSLQCEWDFLQRVVPDFTDAFTPLNKKIKKQFFPAMLGAGVTEAEEALFALTTSLAGLGIFDTTKTATLAYQTSRQGTIVLVEAVKGVDAFDPAQHIETIWAARKHLVNTKEEIYQSVLHSILMQFTSKQKRAIKRAISGKTSEWLSVLPIATCHFDLSPAQFRDGLAVRYMRDPTDLPSKCDGCVASLTLQYALDQRLHWRYCHTGVDTGFQRANC